MDMVPALKLFKILQAHVAAVNELAARLYNDRIEAGDAYTRAVAEIDATLEKISGLVEKKDA